MVLGFLLPKEGSFFDLFDRQTDQALEAARHFAFLVSQNTLEDKSVKRMREIEHQGDDVTHEIMDQLNKTFITPFDREDIHTLAKELDDIVDMIHSIVNRMRVYQVTIPDKNLIAFAEVIDQSVKGVASAVRGLRCIKNSKMILEHCVEVNRLENVGDKMRDEMLAELFEKSKNDPVAIIKWKEIYQDAETVLDICEDVVHVVSSILVKHA